MPWSWISSCIRSVGSDYKISGSRRSVKSVSSGAVTLNAEKLYFVEGYSIGDVEIDSRPAVVQRARIMRHRARLETWSLAFAIEIDDEILPLAQVHEILSDAGRRSGLGDFRVEKGGPFGKFQITAWNILEEQPPQKLSEKRRAS